MTETLPAGWTLAASAFNWTPQVIAARRPADEIVTDIVRAGVSDVIEIEPGQTWRGFPEPTDIEVDALRTDLDAVGGRVSIVGASLDDWTADGRRRSTDERLAFLIPQLRVAARIGAEGVRLPIGQAGAELIDRVLPVLHDLEITLFEEVQGQQPPSSPAHAAAYDAIISRDDPRLRLLVDISMLMPAVPDSYLHMLAAGGVPAELIERLRTAWLEEETLDAVVALLRSGGVPGPVHTAYMNLLIRFGRSRAADLAGVISHVGAFHLKFWDLDDHDGRVSTPVRELGALLAGTAFTGTLCSEWGGHEWLDDDPADITRRHLDLARTALTTGAASAALATTMTTKG